MSFCLLLVLCLILPWQTIAIDVDFQSKMPPDWLSTKQPEGESVDKQLIRKILLRAKGLNYNFFLINHTKAMQLTLEQSNSCMAGVLDSTERRQLYQFSKAFILVQGMHLYVLKDSVWQNKLVAMQNEGKVSILNSWSKDARALLGLDYERSYGTRLDPLVRDPAKAKYLYQKQSGAGIGDLWPMLKQRRVDMILEYPFLLPPEYESLVVGYPVVEAEPDTAAYFACHKGPVGQNIIKQLDQAISELVLDEDYMRLQLEQVEPQYHQLFLQAYYQMMNKPE
jgi:uncharacterized protein (TIGR02285 family)